MKQIPKEILELLQQGYLFVYLFKLEGTKTYYLTSSDESVFIKDRSYYKYSGLHIYEMIQNYSSEDMVKLSGLFENGGIESGDDLTDYKISITMYFPNKNISHHISDYMCSRMIVEGDIFYLHLIPSAADRLNQSVSKIYSKNCRANFGDHRCRVDGSLYKDLSCDKTFVSCSKLFNNAVNFQGEPFIPKILE